MTPAFRLRWLAPVSALVLLTVVTYLPAMRGGFIWDDDQYVTANRELRSFEGLAETWLTPGGSEHSYGQYYPLVHTSFWIEYRLWQDSPLGYHVVNVLLHALAVVLLWRVLVRLSVPGAWLAAAVFAVHPVHVESVAWITERKNVLSGALYLAAALAWLSWVGLDPARPAAAGRRRWWWLSFALFVAALLSKTVTCTLPAALLLVLWWKRGRVRGREVASLTPFVIAGLGLGALTSWIERTVVGASGAEWDFTAVQRVLIAGRALCFYAGKLAWPAGLSFMYPRWDPAAGDALAWACVLAALATFVGLWAARGRLGKGPLVAALFFAGTLAPALGFVNVYPMRYSFVADHFQYLASIGPIAIGSAALAQVGRRASRSVATVAAALLLGTLSMLAWRHEASFRDSETLWSDTLSRNPECWMAWSNLGAYVAAQGRLTEAVADFDEALRLNPRLVEAHSGLGYARLQLDEVDAAIAHYEQALAIDPTHATSHNNFGIVLVRAGRLPEAIDHFRRALELAPADTHARANLGRALLQAGRLPEAISLEQEGLRLRPDDALGHHRLGFALAATGDPASARAQFDAATRLDPDCAPALDSAARLRATCSDATLRDGAEAVRLAERACQLTGRRQAGLLDTLGAAYAESGRFEDAVIAAQEALALAKDETDLAAAVRAHLSLYRARQPCREDFAAAAKR